MDKRLLWAGLLIVLALTAFSVIRWRLQTPPQETPQRLELVRTSLGRFTLPSLESIHNNTTSTYLPVDLDGDGAPEYVFPLGYRRTGSRIAPLRAVSLWTDFNSAPNELPVEVVFPAIGGVDPALLPLKELAGLDRQSGELLRLTRRDGQWRVERLYRDKRRLIAAEWGDADGDGRHDCIVAFSETGNQFYFQPDAQGRWQQRALASPPASMQPQAVAALLAPGANALMLMHIALDDIDGDAAPERFEVRSREIRLSRGQVAKLPLPLVERERLFAAELDGQSPRELVCLQPKFGGLLELHAYCWASGKLVQIAAWRHNAELIDAHVRDLNRDGRKELILGCLPPSAKSIEIVVLEWQQGGLQKRTRSIRTPRQLQVGWYEKLEVEVQHTLYFSASARTRPLSAYLESTTLFLQVDERPEVALEPSRWRWLLQAGVPFWAGDFDGDGTVEYVLQERAEKDHIIRFVQFRNGAWRAASLKHRAPVLAVVPAPVQGKPSLVLVFANGHQESVRFGN